MAPGTIPQTPSRRSKRFEPLATPLKAQAAPAGFECFWNGEPVFKRPCNPALDLSPEELDERDSDGPNQLEDEAEEHNTEETLFYSSFTMKKPRPKPRGKTPKAKPKDDSDIYRPGDTILVETDVLYLQKRPPSVAVIVSMWEVKKGGEDEGEPDPDRMRIRVHWFLRPTELAKIREKREEAPNEIYYSLNSTAILVPSVIVSHCSVSGDPAHIQKAAKVGTRASWVLADNTGVEQKFYCRQSINSQRGIHYSLDWDDHHTRAVQSALSPPPEGSEPDDISKWGQGSEWNVDTTEDKPQKRGKGGQPLKKRARVDSKISNRRGGEQEEADSESDDSGDDEYVQGLEVIEEEDELEEDAEESGDEKSDPEDSTSGSRAVPATPRKRKRGQTEGGAPKTPRRVKKKVLAQPTPHSKQALRERRRNNAVNGTPRKKGRFMIRPPTLSSKPDLSHLPKDPWLRAMHMLHVGNRPDELPCRDDEYALVLRSVGDLLEEGSGGCVYISGVPGTGKTATVHTVVRDLKQMAESNQISPFTYVEINGLRIPEPSTAYSLLWDAIDRNADPSSTSALGMSAQQSLKRLTHHFNGRARGPATHAYVVLMDELDQLVTPKQDVIYNFFNWPTLANSNLVVIAVANTMDLPERVMTGRVRSRLGMTRINFQPYKREQLVEIVSARLQSAKEGLDEEMAATEVLSADAIKLASAKTSSITGDARRVLDICRRVVEAVSAKKGKGGPQHVTKIMSAMQNNPTVHFLSECSLHERVMLASLLKCMKREGVEEIKWGDVVYQHLNYLPVLSGTEKTILRPTNAELALVLDSLVASRAVLLEEGAGIARKAEGERRMLLNVEQSEVERVLSDVGGDAWKSVLSA